MTYYYTVSIVRTNTHELVADVRRVDQEVVQKVVAEIVKWPGTYTVKVLEYVEGVRS